MKTLDACKQNKLYKIIDLKPCQTKIRRRLYDLGFLPKTTLTLARKSLLNKAFLVEIRGYTLSIQKSLAQLILVEET